jgi:two-component system phosphate regulon response regulator PhoB
MPPSVLVISQDVGTFDRLIPALQARGVRVVRGELDALQSERVDLTVLDTDSPKGTDLCREHAVLSPETPFMVVSRANDELDRVVGLTLGAEDYVAKPFSVAELRARVLAILRRAPPLPHTQREVELGRLRICLDTGRAWVNGEEVELSQLESALLCVLASEPGRYFKRDALLQRVWAGQGDPRRVDNVVRRLRLKLGDARGQVRTMRGRGYRLVTE